MSERRYLPVVPPPAPEADAAESVDAPVFERIAIVGLGLLGGSIAIAARRAWPNAIVIGVDRHEVLEKAMVRHAVDVAAPDPMIVSAADFVVLAPPPDDVVRLLADLPSQLQGDAVITDVTPGKRAVIEAAATLPARLPFVAGYPLAAVGEEGLDRARADLLIGVPWLLAPASPDTPQAQAAVEKVAGFLRRLGAVPITLPAAAPRDDPGPFIEQVRSSLEAMHPGIVTAAVAERLRVSAIDWLAAVPSRP